MLPFSKKIKKKLFVLGCAGSSLLNGLFFLDVESGGYPLVAIHGFLIVVASLVSEHGL